MRWLTNFYDFSFKLTATAGIGIHPTKAWLSQLVNFKNAIWTLEERYAIKFCFKLGKNAMQWKLDLLLWPRDQETEFSVEACWLSQTQEGQIKQIHPQTFDDPFFDSTGMIYMHWVPTGQTVNKEYYVEVLREFRKRFRRKRPALFKSGQWHFLQDNPPVHNSILVTDYLTKMGIKTVPQPPYSPDLDPCDFWLFPKLRVCRYETIEEMKEAVMKVIDTLTQEDFHGAFQKLLERYKCIAAGGDYFMCVLSIKVALWKKSVNLFNDPCTALCCIVISPSCFHHCFIFFCYSFIDSPHWRIKSFVCTLYLFFKCFLH